ncbi:MAG TPA: GNAT family N-acetyltransferase [Gemmatimonadales bacterium]|nr:GNAT family N-acetyltransferase [Gemmatimonadales bacterium]
MVDGAEAYLAYAAAGDGVLDYHTTFVPPELRERHLASALTRHALDYARDQDLRIIPSCWFVAGYVERHPEYTNLVAGDVPPE